MLPLAHRTSEAQLARPLCRILVPRLEPRDRGRILDLAPRGPTRHIELGRDTYLAIARFERIDPGLAPQEGFVVARSSFQVADALERSRAAIERLRTRRV